MLHGGGGDLVRKLSVNSSAVLLGLAQMNRPALEIIRI